MAENGRLPASALATIPGGSLRKDAAAAWNAMHAYIKANDGIDIRPSGSRSSYRTYSEQQYFWDLYQRGEGNLAAYPGTSNHGLGLAVDVATQEMRAAIDRHGRKFGWAKEWSDAQSEWWHLRWREGNYPAVKAAANPWPHSTKREKRALSALTSHRQAMAREKKTGKGPKYRTHQAAATVWKWRLSAMLPALRRAREKHGRGWHHVHERIKTIEKVRGPVGKEPSRPKAVSKPSPEIAKAIAEFEGGQSKDGLFHPYRDEVGVWTIGYGHTENVDADDPPLTKAAATELLRRDLDGIYSPPLAKALARYGIKPNQKEFDGLLSAVYNLGPGILQRGRSLGDALHARDIPAAADSLLLYDHAGAERLAGLTRRRRWERQLILGGTYRTE